MSLTKIGRYEVQAELGRGAMGIVYRGFDPNINRTVAIKTILLDTGNPQAIQRFQREAQAAGNLSHPNIVTVYDAGEDQGLFYIAMELLEGETLQQILERGRIPVEQAIAIVEQVGEALDYAHSRQIIHRDVKPANIMVSEGRVKVTDFGIAKISGSAMTTTGQILGTPAYLSPELVEGRTVDGRSDLFSLGTMLYEMLTGVRPFAGDNLTAILYRILQADPPPPSVVNPSLPLGLDYPVMKTLAKDPGARYRNCAEFLKDLKDYPALAERVWPAEPRESVVAAAPSRVPTGSAVADRKKLRIEPAAKSRTDPAAWVRGKKVVLAVGLLLAALAGILWQTNRPQGPGSAPVEQQAAPPPVSSEKSAPGSPAKEASPPARTNPAGEAIPQTRQAAPPPSAPPAQPQPPASPKPSPWLATTGEVGRLTVHTDPQGARILIDGAETPYRSPVNFALPPGRYQVTLERRGYASETREVVVSKDRIVELQLDLKRD